jgi:hypothetical protein
VLTPEDEKKLADANRAAQDEPVQSGGKETLMEKIENRIAEPAIRGDILFEHATFRYRVDGPVSSFATAFR